MSINYANFSMINSSNNTSNLYLSSNTGIRNTSLVAAFGNSGVQEAIAGGIFYCVIENFGEVILNRVFEQTVSLSKWSFSFVKNSFSMVGSYVDNLFSRAVSFPSTAHAVEVLPVPCDAYPEQLELLKKILKNQDEELSLQKQTLEILKQMKEKDLKVKELEAGLPNLNTQLNSLNEKIPELYDGIVKESQRLSQMKTGHYETARYGGKTVENPDYVQLARSIETDKNRFCQLCKERKEVMRNINQILDKIEKETKVDLRDRKVSKSCKEFKFLESLIALEKCC